MIIINSKNYLVWGVVALVVVLAGYYLVKGYQSPASQTQNQPVTVKTVTPTRVAATSAEVKAKVTADYTDSGFTPKTVTVKLGDTVTWTNKSGKAMWVASAPHPVHTDLPGFDQLKSVGKGDTYSYTFTKVGSWKYHNHLGPTDTGTVVVK